jgi:hypothetical protein
MQPLGDARENVVGLQQNEHRAADSKTNVSDDDEALARLGR